MCFQASFKILECYFAALRWWQRNFQHSAVSAQGERHGKSLAMSCRESCDACLSNWGHVELGHQLWVEPFLPSFPTFLIAFSIYVPFIPYWRFIQYLHIWLTNRNLAARKKGKKIIPTFLRLSGFMQMQYYYHTTLLQTSTVFAIRIDWKCLLFVLKKVIEKIIVPFLATMQ